MDEQEVGLPAQVMSDLGFGAAPAPEQGPMVPPDVLSSLGLSDVAGSGVMGELLRPKGAPSEEGIKAIAEWALGEGVPSLIEGEGAMSGAAIGSGLTQGALSMLPLTKPIMRLPWARKGASLVGGAVGATVGQVLGEEASDVQRQALGLPPKTEGLDFSSERVAESALKGGVTVTLAGLLKKVFGQPGKTSARFRNDSNENFAKLIGARSKDYKGFIYDEQADESISAVLDDIDTVAEHGFFSKIGSSSDKLRTEATKQVTGLTGKVDPALSAASRDIAENFTPKTGIAEKDLIYNTVRQKLDTLREQLKLKYADADVRNQALAAVDSAEGGLLLLAKAGELNLSSLNTLKRNWYVERINFDSAGLIGQRVKNTVAKDIAYALKNSVEDVANYSASFKTHGGETIHRMNDLASSYIVVRDILEASKASLLAEGTKANLSQASLPALTLGAIAYAAYNPEIRNPVTLGLAGYFMGKEAMKLAPIRAQVAGAQRGMGDIFGAAEKITKIPGLGPLIKGAGMAGLPVVSEQVAEPIVDKATEAKVNPFMLAQANAQEMPTGAPSADDIGLPPGFLEGTELRGQELNISSPVPPEALGAPPGQDLSVLNGMLPPGSESLPLGQAPLSAMDSAGMAPPIEQEVTAPLPRTTEEFFSLDAKDMPMKLLSDPELQTLLLDAQNGTAADRREALWAVMQKMPDSFEVAPKGPLKGYRSLVDDRLMDPEEEAKYRGDMLEAFSRSESDYDRIVKKAKYLSALNSDGTILEVREPIARMAVKKLPKYSPENTKPESKPDSREESISSTFKRNVQAEKKVAYAY